MSAALAAASLREALSFHAASSRVFLAQAARSAVVWASVLFCGVVSILSPLFIPPEEGGLVGYTCTMDFFLSVYFINRYLTAT